MIYWQCGINQQYGMISGGRQNPPFIYYVKSVSSLTSCPHLQKGLNIDICLEAFVKCEALRIRIGIQISFYFSHYINVMSNLDLLRTLHDLVNFVLTTPSLPAGPRNCQNPIERKQPSQDKLRRQLSVTSPIDPTSDFFHHLSFALLDQCYTPLTFFPSISVFQTIPTHSHWVFLPSGVILHNAGFPRSPVRGSFPGGITPLSWSMPAALAQMELLFPIIATQLVSEFSSQVKVDYTV